MSAGLTNTNTVSTASAGPLSATPPRLSSWRLAAVGVAIAGVVALAFAVTPLAGRAEYGVVTWLAVTVGVYAFSRVQEGSRRAKDRLATILLCSSFAVALAPLISVLTLVIGHGLHRLDGTFLWHSMRNVPDAAAGGGAYHAIVGTLEQVGIATVICVPTGLLVAVYLVEYGRGRLSKAVSTSIDVMTGLPSIVAGLFIVAVWVVFLGHGPKSGFAGSLALSILMLPVVVRSCEEILRLVPDALREASLALGVPRWRTILAIVLPTAVPGITTGIMLAVARVTGETAPLLLTVFGNPSINFNPFSGPQEGLPLFVFDQALLPNPTAIDRAWSGALVLILIVVVFNLSARLLTRVGFTRRLSRKG